MAVRADGEQKIEAPHTNEESFRDALIEADAVKKAVAVLMEALEATTPQGWVDHRNRIDAACRIMDRIDGRPVERKEQKNMNLNWAPSLDQIMQSAGAREELQRQIDNAGASPAKIAKVRAA